MEDNSEKMEATICSLHGDMRSIQRQLDQRQIARDIAIKFGEPFDDDAYSDWMGKTRRAFSHKREQAIVLERELGKLREGKSDPKYIHVDLLLDIVREANNRLADEDKSDAEVERLLEILDKSWPDWS